MPETPFPPRAVVLLALGTPRDAGVPAVRRFLREFLSDRRVVALPWILRKALVELVILPRRAAVAAARYRKIETPRGMPLAVFTEALRERVRAALGNRVPVFAAMRYGEPSAESVAREIARLGVREVAVLPQFPQYAESSFETAVAHFSDALKRFAPRARARVAAPFYAAPGYVEAVAETLRGFVGEGRDFLFSFHGVPVKSLVRVARGKRLACDPARAEFSEKNCVACAAAEKCYRRQCFAGAAAIAAAAGIPRERFRVAFQSRFGGGAWLLPATADEKISDATVVVAPGFTADNLETLLELRELGAGTLAPCLNDSPRFAEFLAREAESLFAGEDARA